MNKPLYIAWMLLIFLFPSIAHSQVLLRDNSEGQSFVVERVVGGLDIPWGMTFLSNRELLTTERNGGLVLIDTTSGDKKRINGVPAVLALGQGGLLDVAVPPDYSAGDWIYFTYSKEINRQGATTLARARLQATQLTDWQDLLVTDSRTKTSRHFGSRIAFDEKGFVYFTVGDRGERPYAQGLENHAGKVLRVTREGKTPSDNPFVMRADALAEIWSLGHRNPQGIAYDFSNKILWTIEHGPRGGDEINLIQPGKNYGWPLISYGKEYWGPLQVGEGSHKPGMEQPVKYYVPSIAPGSLIIYTGDAFPGWRGNLLTGALKLRHLNRVVVDTHSRAVKEERLLEKLDLRIRALAQAPDGIIYLSTDSGDILRIRPGN